MFSYLRRHSKRSFVCLYIACATFLVCAFYTLYTESYVDTSIQNSLSPDILTPLENELFQKTQRESFQSSNRDFILPVVSWTTNSSMNQSVPSSSKESPRTKSQKITKVDTKYVYLTKPPFRTKTTKFTPPPSKSTTVALQDTCQTFTMKDSKLILLWTPFFEEWNYFQQERITQCKSCRNCIVTNDRTKLEESDAVIFHARDMSLSDLPSIRYPHQRWVFFCLESPPYSDFPGMEHMRSMFNWTMTYRTDSDIVEQYGKFVRIHPSRKLDLQSLQLAFANKTKSVVWMSSHCPTHGGRDDYVDELSKYIDVDVYGKCGTSVCPPNRTNSCLRDFSSKYKFFLAFENTICKDYVTEKFFRTLEYNMIPVVFGGASYSKLAPSSSFIDAMSFKSPKHLAFFLAGIGKDFKMWSSYFRWRKDYNVDTGNHRECDLCSMLHKKGSKSSSYEDFRKWWVGDANCRAWKPKR